MNLSPECERRRIGVEFLVETTPSLCKCVGELLGSGMQSRVIPFQQLILYWKTPVNTGWPRSQKWPWTLSRAWALKSPRSVQFSSPSGCSDVYYWWPSTILSRPAPAELLCTAEPKQVQRPAWSRSCSSPGCQVLFLFMHTSSTNRDYLILAYKLRRTCRESFFFSFFIQ